MRNNLTITIKDNQLRFSDQLVSDSMSHDQLVDILKLAIEEQETDLKNWVNAIKEKSHGHLLWAATWTDLRQDDLVGLNWYYFLEQIIVYIRQAFQFDTILIDIPVLSPVASYLKSRYGNLVFTQKPSWKKQVRAWLAPFKLIRTIFKKPTVSSLYKNGYWFSSPIDTHKHRYRDLLEQIGYKDPHQFFHANHYLTVKAANYGQSLNFSAWAKGSDWISAYKNVIQLRSKLKTTPTDSLLLAFLKQIKIQHFAGMVLREKWIERAMRALQPKAIFFATANAYSPARLMSRLAYRLRIPFYVFACRSMFTSLRMEERAIKADLEKVNDAHVADAFLVWDEFSRQTLIKQGFPEEVIYVHQSNKNTGNKKMEVTNRFLLLFTHDKEQNDALINVLEEVQPDGAWAIRMHPLQPLTAIQEKRLGAILPEYLDTSSVKMNAVKFQNVIALSINSTAAVEASSYGTGVLWLPFLNFRSIVFDEVMSILGEKVNSKIELKISLEVFQLDVHRKQLIEKSQEAYQKHFVGKDSLDAFLNKLEAIS